MLAVHHIEQPALRGKHEGKPEAGRSRAALVQTVDDAAVEMCAAWAGY